MRDEGAVETFLEGVEKEHDIRITFAAEVGSRAWGLDSPHSDHDLQFIYVRPPSYYISIRRTWNDVIKCKDDESARFDMVGWDVKKALTLLRESNPGLIDLFHEQSQTVGRTIHFTKSDGTPLPQHG